MRRIRPENARMPLVWPARAYISVFGS